MDDSYLLSTPENIELSYQPAGLGTRFLAAMIDSLVLGVILLLILIGGLLLALAGQSFGDAASTLIVAVMVLLSFVVFTGYYIFFESIWRGQSPGKRVLGLRVMRDDGLPLTFSASVIRNLIRFFDFLPGTYGLGIIAMFTNKRWKRLGDMAAGTIVVHDVRHELPRELRLPPPPNLAGGTPPMRNRLTSEQYDLVREYLLRQQALSSEARERIGEALAVTVEERTGVPRPDGDPGGYLRSVMALQAERDTA